MTADTDWHRELCQRRTRLWRSAEERGCDLLLVYGSPQHVEPFRYLTDFVPVLGDTWALMTGPEAVTCVLNFHWELREAEQRSGLSDWHGYFDPVPFLAEVVHGSRPTRIGLLGMHRIPWVALEAVKAAAPEAELTDAGGILDEMRRIKSPLEIRLLRESAAIAAEAIAEVRSRLEPGLTENELTARVVSVFNQRGAGSAFRPVVQAGVDADSAVIARAPRARPIEAGDTVMMDIGAEHRGYMSDVARTFVLGEPGDLQRRVWRTVQAAYDAVLSSAKPGVPCNQLHRVAQAEIEDAGFRLIHRIGHGVGLGTSFEWPSLDTEEALLEPGMTFCVEPGIYEPGAGAMKIEDMVVVTDDGCELLSTAPYDLGS
jgi:Xaa-Pro aminopeptidase